MEKYQRLCPGDPMIRKTMRQAMAMIELIFAIVIIAISIISIPSMISVADKAAKGITIDDDVMSRLSGWVIDKFQARWDQNYGASGSGLLRITGDTDMPCNRGMGTVWYRENNDSSVQCDDQNRTPSTILALGDGNLSKGIEQLNGGSEILNVIAASGESYDVTASYRVRYVDSALVSVVNNTATDTWTLGSSTSMAPDGVLTPSTHLKRVVVRFQNETLGVDTALSFFKSNKGN